MTAKATSAGPSAPANTDFRATRLGRYLVARRSLVLFGLPLFLALLISAKWGDAASEGSVTASLGVILRRDGLTLDEGSVTLLREPKSAWSVTPALFIAAAQDGAPDVYYAELRATPAGKILDINWRSNLTRTGGAAERDLVRIGDHVAYASLIDGKLDAVVVLDTRGEGEALTSDWPWRARTQNAITNLQETGRTVGVGRRRYKLATPATTYALSAKDDRFILEADRARVVLNPWRETPVSGAENVEVRPNEKGMPGTITWVVDTVRNSDWVGPAPIEWLENRVFAAKDWAQRKWYGFFGTSATDTEQAVADDIGAAPVSTRRRLELAKTNAETGWPPAPMKTLMKKIRGEGEWIPVVDDPYVKQWPGAPPLFFQSFIRVDEERAYTRVYATIWDPRQLQLHVMTGTKEPASATGETGSGMAPRDPDVLETVVAGFNGGFQALHGEFGMMADGKVYLPPKPWAATVAVYDDGRVGVGSWMAPPKGVREFDENWAVAQIPKDVVALRQNLTSVVEDGKYNPWERWWWGAAPLNADEQTYIDRSGVCLTKEGFMVYFWGQSMGADSLGRAMLAARCVRGVHLDMNSSHTGFEYYNVQRTPFASALPKPPDADSEFEGAVPLAPQLHLRARRMVRSMTTMRFPRYIGRDGRDFFYLTVRPTLPGPALPDPGSGEGAGLFSADGMPQTSYPHATAKTFVGGAPGTRTWVVRIDPRRAPPLAVATQTAAASVAAGHAAATGAPRVLAYLTHGTGGGAAKEGGVALYAEREQLGYRYRVGKPQANATVLLHGAPLQKDSRATAALGVDRFGFLVYAEAEDHAANSLADVMTKAGAPVAIALDKNERLALRADDATFASPDAYERVVDPKLALPFVAATTPAAEVLNPDLKPLTYYRWAKLQDARVRYFREGPARFQMPVDGGVPDEGADPASAPK